MSLQTALETAYRNNPSLLAERANTKQVNEGLRERVGAALPQVTGSASTSIGGTRTYTPNNWNDSWPASIGVSVSQVLYRGGAVGTGIQFDRLGAQAQWAGLRATETQILNSVAQAYIAVAKQEALGSQYSSAIKLQQNQVAAAQARFDLGEGTRTDVAQAQSRLAVVRANAQQASNGASTARANVTQLTGGNVGSVSVPHFPFALPHNRGAAVEAALAFDATVAARRFQLELANLNIELAKTAGRPTVDATASATHGIGDVRRLIRNEATNSTSFSIGLNARVPIYQGGQVRSQVEQARFALQSAQANLEAARAAARNAAVTAWNDMTNARALGGSYAAQRNAALVQVEGAQAELEVGTKTALDVLEAQQTLTEANVGLVNARYDEVAAAYRLYAATGRLTARDMNLRVTPFDAEADYERVRQILDQVGPYIPALRFSNALN